jgi:hypothetical protein
MEVHGLERYAIPYCKHAHAPAKLAGDLTSQVDAPGGQVDEPASLVDGPANEVDVPASQVDAPASQPCSRRRR